MRQIANLFLLGLFFAVYQAQGQLDTTNVVGEAINLGTNVNSPCYDYRPKISPDGSTLYFTRILCNSEYNADESLLFISELDDSGQWQKASPLEAAFNNKERYPYVYSITPDNNQLLLTLVNPANGKRDLCLTRRTKEGWSEPEILDIGITIPALNSTFCLSNNGKVLLFSYDGNETKQKSLGNKDLYVTFRQPDDSWSPPEHTGAVLNTPNVDFGPFLASDDKTLYYSSKHDNNNLGSNDIYMSRRLDNSWTNWSEPINLGQGINDDDWNDGFFIPAIGDYAYFNSTKNSVGQGDIFKIQIRKAIQPDAVVLIEGRLLDPEGNPVDARIRYENLETGEEAGIARTNPTDGSYKITLPYGVKYGIYAESEGYYSLNNYLDLTESGESQIVQQDLKVEKLEVGNTIRLNNIFFDTGKYELRKASFSELKRLVSLLNLNPEMRIEIAGHTDSSGSEQANQTLSENRALAVYKYLIQSGVSSQSIQNKGYGATKPVDTNETASGRKNNRRVEFTIIAQ